MRREGHRLTILRDDPTEIMDKKDVSYHSNILAKPGIFWLDKDADK